MNDTMMWVLGVLVVLLLAVALLASIRIAARRTVTPAHGSAVPRQRVASDAVRALNREYAAGQISDEEYHRRRTALETTGADNG